MSKISPVIEDLNLDYFRQKVLFSTNDANSLESELNIKINLQLDERINITLGMFR
ncbi:MAG: hypothetical protein ACJAWS_000515 [Oleiphilaceae bacterium]|jgi:hypothetical protein